MKINVQYKPTEDFYFVEFNCSHLITEIEESGIEMHYPDGPDLYFTKMVEVCQVCGMWREQGEDLWNYVR